jgi:inhibitor of cysteine peptidase
VGPPQARRDLLTPGARLGRRGRRAAALAALVAGCVNHPAREADRAFTAGLPRVDQVEIWVVSTRPPRIRVDVRGTLPDPCTAIDRVDTRRLAAQVEITLTTRRPFGADCAPEETPFTRSIPVMLGGEFRLWVVKVNGVASSVSLPPDRGVDDRSVPYRN